MLMIVAFPKSYIEVVVQRQDLTELNNQETDDEFEIANHKREIANKEIIFSFNMYLIMVELSIHLILSQKKGENQAF